jgi:hypothetical protein
MPPTTSLSTVSSAPAGARILGRQPGAHRGGCFLQQTKEVLARHVLPRAHLHRQRVVAVRSFDQHAEAGVGEAGTRIPGNGLHDLPVAARHQHLGDRLAQRLALGDGGEVLLALIRGIGDEVGLVEPLGCGQDRAGDLDVVVEGQHADHAAGRILHRSEPVRELGAGLGLDRGHQLDHDLVEQIDLAFGIATAAFDEEVGDAREHGDALCIGAGGKRALELFDQRWGHIRLVPLVVSRHHVPTTMKKRLRRPPIPAPDRGPRAWCRVNNQ